jgi:hypothetical protein
MNAIAEFFMSVGSDRALELIPDAIPELRWSRRYDETMAALDSCGWGQSIATIVGPLACHH